VCTVHHVSNLLLIAPMSHFCFTLSFVRMHECMSQGTTNFVHGFPFTCVSIGFARGGSVELGIIYDPVKDEMFQAVKGHGVWLNGKRQHASDATAMAHSLIITCVLY
jgi:Inositol monophosphatase family